MKLLILRSKCGSCSQMLRSSINPIFGPYSTASLVNKASFSCWALMKASLKRLASRQHQLVMPPKFPGSARRHVLSLLANRMAKVWGSGSPSLTSAAAFQTQLLSLPTLGDSFISGTTKIVSWSTSQESPRFTPTTPPSENPGVKSSTYHSGSHRPSKSYPAS